MNTQEALFQTPVAQTGRKHPAHWFHPTAPLQNHSGHASSVGNQALFGHLLARSIAASTAIVATRTCVKSVEKFVMHPRLGIWVCSCVLRFDEQWQAREKKLTEGKQVG